MPKLKPNEAICHECGEVIDLNRLEFRFRESDGKFYHYECMGNRITLEEVLLWTLARHFRNMFNTLQEILNEGDNDSNSVNIVPWTEDTCWQGKDDNDVSDDQEE